MYSKIRIIISSSFFGAGLRKKENKKKYCFWEKNLYLSSMTMSPKYSMFGFKIAVQYQSLNGLDFHRIVH